MHSSRARRGARCSAPECKARTSTDSSVSLGGIAVAHSPCMTRRGGLVAIRARLHRGVRRSGGIPHATVATSGGRRRLATRRARSAAGQAWLRAGDDVLAASDPVTTPVRRTSELGLTLEATIAYRLTLPSGRRLSLAVAFEARAPGRLFVDLFRLESGAALQLVASLASSRWSLIRRDSSTVGSTLFDCRRSSARPAVRRSRCGRCHRCPSPWLTWTTGGCGATSFRRRPRCRTPPARRD